MNRLRRAAAASLALGVFVPSAIVRAAADHGAETPFFVLDRPLPTEAPGKVEVIEFFWYGCPHCAQVEPFVEAWESKLPGDVMFRREHVIWDARAETQTPARLFLTLRTMGIVRQHQQAVFDAVHKDRTDFRNEKAVYDWAAKRGIDRSRFESIYKSFGIEGQLRRSKALTTTYGIDGVPTFIINGRYSTEPHRAGGERQLIQIIDRLIRQERSAIRR
jgi:thiol:disulfide interchange protein DsbA